MSSDGRRLSLPLLISLLAHALLLSLQFGSQEFGLPGFALPWQDRRVEAPDLRAVLAPPAITAEPAPPLLSEPVPVAGPLSASFKSPVPPSAQPAPALKLPSTPPLAKASPKPKAATSKTPAKVLADLPSDAPAEVLSDLPAVAPADSAPPKPFPAVIAIEQSKEAEFVVPAAPPEPVITDSTAPGNTGGAAQARKEQAARERVAEEEVARAEAVRLEAERQENAQQAAARQEAASAESARLEAARVEAARIEAERRENARQVAAQKEAARQEAARAEAARAEAARIEAERRENAQQAATQQEVARQEAARAEAAQLDAKREQDAKRDAVRKAMGRQLDEEAARRKAAEETRPRSPSASPLRRGRLFGRTDPNGELIEYAEAWSRKIHFSTAFELVREAARQPYTDPMVTVAIRSDGSVESVTFVRSSGVPAIDDAVRRIVHNQTPYLPFQPGLARDFDVIEIRRTWHFDTAIRLY